MRNNIGQEEFVSIVTGVLEAQADVQAYTIKDKGVYISMIHPDTNLPLCHCVWLLQ